MLDDTTFYTAISAIGALSGMIIGQVLAQRETQPEGPTFLDRGREWVRQSKMDVHIILMSSGGAVRGLRNRAGRPDSTRR